MRCGVLKLDIKPAWEDPFYLQMRDLGVAYVHGTNSHALEGIARYRAVLSMEEIDVTSWFYREGGLKSGEASAGDGRGYTRVRLFKKEPISCGVNMYDVLSYYNSMHYAKIGDKDAFPVLIGFSEVPVKRLSEHVVSIGGIGMDKVVAIYVPFIALGRAQQLLKTNPRLISKLRTFTSECEKVHLQDR